jgi:hypothetical protein
VLDSGRGWYASRVYDAACAPDSGDGQGTAGDIAAAGERVVVEPKPLQERLTITIPKSLKERIDDFRFLTRRESRSEAIVALIEAGLAQQEAGGGPKNKPAGETG